MEPFRPPVSKSVASFHTTQTRTPDLSTGLSPYFSSPSQQSIIDRSNSTYFTPSASPDSSSLRHRRPGVVHTPSYDYYGENSETGYTSRTPSYDPQPAKSTVSRASTSCTTRTSRTSRTPLPDGENHKIVCALAEARGVTPSVGKASINIATGEVILSQISDSRFFTRTIHKLQILEPTVVLMVSSSCPPNPKSRLYSHIEDNMPGTKIVSLDRKHWSETEGMERVNTFAFREDSESIKVALNGSFYATCSFSAAMSYLETQCALRIYHNSLRVRFQPCEDTMMIDVSTIVSLEILQNLRKPKSKDSLIGLLRHTRTPMGARVLRSNLLQPSTLKELYLDPRYEAVEELHRSQDMFVEVRSALDPFPDIEKMLTQLVIIPNQPSVAATETSMNNVLKVKAFVDAMPGLYQALSPAVSPLLTKIREPFRPEKIAPVRDLIYETIHEDVRYAKNSLDLRNQRTFAVKPGVNGLLDVARQAYKENTEEVQNHVDLINVELGLPAQIQYDHRRGYSLRIREVEFEDRLIPPVLVNVTRKRGNIECMTIRLKQLNQRITDSVSEVAMQCDKVIQDLIDSIRTEITSLYRICESIALLDMLASFAHVSSMNDWVRPQITDTLALKNARHPILDKNLQEEYIPNDYYASDDYRFQIVTGCNMSGKSTYIKSISLLQIIAQIGCFVPAESASFPVIHSIFARVTADDSIEANLSCFSMEMREMAFILGNVDNKSMVIIDELGRATSARDGLAIAVAMAEALVQSRAKVWFATHFSQLAEVLNDRPGVLNLHLGSHLSSSANGDPKLTMTYRVETGKLEQELYGIILAKAMGFPERLLEKAEQVSRSLREQRMKNRQSSEARKVLSERKLMIQLHAQLKQAYKSEMDDSALRSYLKRLQVEFVNRLEALHGGEVAEEDNVAEVMDEDDGDADMYDDEDVFDTVDIESLSMRS